MSFSISVLNPSTEFLIIGARERGIGGTGMGEAALLPGDNSVLVETATRLGETDPVDGAI